LDGEELLGELFANAAQYEMGLHAGLHYSRRKGLVDIIDGSDFEAARFVLRLGLAGEEDDRDVFGFGIGLKAHTDFVAVHTGHEHVEQDEVGRRSDFHQLQSLWAVSGDADLVEVLKNGVHHLNVGGGVVHQQHNFLQFVRFHVRLISVSSTEFGDLVKPRQRLLEIKVFDGFVEGFEVRLIDHADYRFL
jgi:hypothetical protein